LRRIEGYVIVSTDGMIADNKGVMPESIRNDADQRHFQANLDSAAAVVHGRHSHEGGPRAARRKRLLLTRQIAAIAPDPLHPNALLWNPLGVTLEEALRQLGVTGGTIAIIGGREAFSLFLPLYDAFGRRACTARSQPRTAPRSRQGRGRYAHDLAAGIIITFEFGPVP
jgi:dihydrofolate reductase